MISLRIPPEVHWVLRKYSKGEYQVALRELIKRYARKLVLKAKQEAGQEELVELENVECFLDGGVSDDSGE